MSRAVQDQFIYDDDEAECCPLCVEEFDLSDKNFRPCVCGYQICQFCYNNIKNTMNGLCPACRRQYDDKTIEFKAISAEEMANYKADQAQQAKKKAAARQKEAQKREADIASRKHLSGLRVIQKNLVYVTGMTPTIREEQLLHILRGDQYFGQYGKIVKIVVSKAKDSSHTGPNQPVGVYVTFANKEDAATCIALVDGSQNYDRTLRAQYGTTKYCSAYLRGENCNNKNCMFLHEPGEESDSFTRQDLSSMNIISTQSTAHPKQSPQPPAHLPRAQEKHDGTASPIDTSSDAPGLPSSASWGVKTAQPQSDKRGALSASSSTLPRDSSKSSSLSKTTDADATTKFSRKPSKESSGQSREEILTGSDAARCAENDILKPTRHLDDLIDRVKNMKAPIAKWAPSHLSARDRQVIESFPPLFDLVNGPRLRRERLQQQKEAEAHQRQDMEALEMMRLQAAEQEESSREGGSSQLGGEPEERAELSLSRAQQHIIQPPSQIGSAASSGILPNPFLVHDLSNLGVSARSNASQQQQLLLQQFKSSTPSSHGLFKSLQTAAGLSGQTNNANLNNNNGGIGTGISGHVRHTSRYNFTNDSLSTTPAVKPIASSKFMSQQSSMLPHVVTQLPSNSQPSLRNQFYAGGVQGPPPGLKPTGTPPVSGGGMFGQAHGFAIGGVGYNNNNSSNSSNNGAINNGVINGASNSIAGRNSNEEMMRGLLRSRTANPGATNQLLDLAKLDVADPSILQARLHQGSAIMGQGLYSNQAQDDMAQQLASNDNFQSYSYNGDNSGAGGAATSSVQTQPQILPASRQPSLSVWGEIGRPVKPIGSRETAQPIGFRETVQPIGPRNTVQPTVSRDATRAVDSREAVVTPVIPVVPLVASAKPGIIGNDRPEALLPEALPKAPEITARSAPPKGVKALGATSASAGANTKDAKVNPVPKAVARSVKGRGAETTATSSKPILKESKDTMGKGTILTESVSSNKPAETAPVPTSQDIGKLTPATEENKPIKPNTAPKAQNIVSPEPTASVNLESTMPSTTTSSQSATSAKRIKNPRTLRVLPPKAEPQASTASSSTATSTVTPSVPTAKSADKSPSRKGSIAAATNTPSTPASERVFDNASINSAPISRASSPNQGGKNPSVPPRSKTKQQLKKERTERAKQFAAEKDKTEDPPLKAVDENSPPPLVSRKKKAKKTANKAFPSSATPVLSRVASPTRDLRATATDEAEEPHDDPFYPDEEEEATTPIAAAAVVPESSTSYRMSRVGQTVGELVKSVESLTGANLSTHKFFQSASNLYVKPEINKTDISTFNKEVALTPEQLDNINNHETLRFDGGDGRTLSRALVTPRGTYVRALSDVEETRYLELETRLAAEVPPRTFVPASPSCNEIVLPPILHHAARAKILKKAMRSPTVEDPLQMNDQFLVEPAGMLAPPDRIVVAATAAMHSVNYTAGLKPSPLTKAPDASLNIDGLSPASALVASVAGTKQAPSSMAAKVPGSMQAPPLRMPSVDDMEGLLLRSSKETESLEKKLQMLIRKNRRLAFSSS